MKEMYKNIDGKRIKMTESEIQDLLKRREKPQELINQEKISECKQYLANTDYIITKISEAMADNDEKLLAELKDKYADVLIKRKEARENVNKLETENLKTELKDIQNNNND